MLQVREHHHDGVSLIRLNGPFCRTTTTEVQTRISGATKMGCHHIILDFSGVTGFDAIGLADLHLWSIHLKACHKHISLVKSQIYVGKHLDWGLLSSIVPIYASKEEAVEHTGK